VAEEHAVPRPDDEPASYRALGERCLADYYARYQPFDRDHTSGGATPHLSARPEGEVRVQGYVDRLRRAPMACEDSRLQTGKYLPTQQQVDADRQLALYEIGVRHAWPDVREVELVWHYLAHDVELRSRRSADDLAKARGGVLELVKVVESDQEFARGRDPLRLVPVPRDLSRLVTSRRDRAAGTAAVCEDAGVQLVDRYARLKASSVASTLSWRRAGGSRLLCEQESLERVRGTEHVVTVKHTSALRFPSKDDDARPELERLVKDHGRWDEVSELNVRALAKVLEVGRWPQALIDGLRASQRGERGARAAGEAQAGRRVKCIRAGTLTRKASLRKVKPWPCDRAR